MADVVLTVTVPEAKVAVATEGFLKIYPNVETVSAEDQTPKYTTKEWVNEMLRRILVRDIRRGLQMIAQEEANVELDDSLAQ